MTTSTPKASKIAHPWSRDALLAKAQRYAQDMLLHSRDDWHFGLTSTFVLEFLARAALANVSPTLLADSKSNWNNLYYSLGHTPTEPKFIPHSIHITEVLKRLREILPAFIPEEGFTAQHINRRNEELHAGSTPFDGLETRWLADFYQTCSVLLAALGESLALLVGGNEARFAEQLIAASRDKSAKAVSKAIAGHKKNWKEKDNAERQKLSSQASAWATRQDGHRVTCPSCGSDSLVTGAPISVPIRKLEDDLIVETQDYLPAKFECVACQLKIAGLAQLSASNLSATYKATFTYDAADYYARDDQYPGFDDDNNEY